MSIEQGVTSGTARATSAQTGPAQGNTAAAGEAAPFDFASLLFSLGAGEAAETDLADSKPEGADLNQPALATEASAQPPLPQQAPGPEAATQTTTGAEQAGAAAAAGHLAASRGQAGAAATTQADGIDLATGQRATAQVPATLLRQAAYTQRLNQQRGQVAEATAATAALAQLQAQSQQAQTPGRGEDLMARLGGQKGEALLATTGASQIMLANTGSTTGTPAFDRLADRAPRERLPGSNDLGLGALGGASLATAATSSAQPVLPAAPDSGLTTQMQVAEQVSYWAAQGVQNAELEVQGLDEKPIHVSIELQGVEARVAFRAEQAETRQVLQDAVPHLRELMEREGLVLSGVSVGQSGANAQGGRQQGQSARPSSGVRRAEVVVPELATRSASRAQGGGGSVDLFV